MLKDATRGNSFQRKNENVTYVKKDFHGKICDMAAAIFAGSEMSPKDAVDAAFAIEEQVTARVKQHKQMENGGEPRD